MSEVTLIEQGLDLMLYGMGTVFIFLTLIVSVTTTMSSIIQRWLPDDDFEITPSPSTNFGVDERVAAVIQAALAQHRCRHK